MSAQPVGDIPVTPEEKLAALVACRTVSAADERDETEFARFRELFARFYPLMHSALEREIVDGGTLLFRWRGLSESDPIVLMAHYDVVPAPADQWTNDPFAGTIEDGWIHGRGVLDDKGPLVCIAEAVEQLLAEGFVPTNDVWLSFGHDEEVFGSGAEAVVDLLRERRIRPWLVNDEGGAIVKKAFPGLRGRQAVIGIVEKGTVDVELRATGEGGHASAPSRRGPVAQIAEAVVRIDKAVDKPTVTDPVRKMFAALAEAAPAPLRLILRRIAGRDRLLGVILARLGPETAAMVRTTMAPTRLSGSPANNVLATDARVNVNVRLLPGDTVGALRSRLRRLLRGLDVEIFSVKGENPPPTSSTDSAAWQHLCAAIAALDQKIAPVPFMLMGGTDGRHFTKISAGVYRFAPLEMSAEQRASIHAADERLSVASLRSGIEFHRALLTLPRPSGE